MRGDIVYRVYGVHEGREKNNFFGAFRSRSEAEAHIEQLRAKQMNGRNWAEQYHNRGFEICETVVETEFEIPSLPKPRDKYFIKGTVKPNRPGTWDSTIVEVFRRTASNDELEKVGKYERSYAILQTFEPFRQGNKEFALISRDYTRTAVLDLQNGNVIAEEPENQWGFCPVGFYVPDWWDVNDGTVIPGSEYWHPRYEWPTGDFGFVWGCIWGDDGSWKVQYLDLSKVQQGVIQREERFGYLELATAGYATPCLSPGPQTNQRSKPPHFISVSRHNVTFAVEMQFGLDTGKSDDWQRLRVTTLE